VTTDEHDKEKQGNGAICDAIFMRWRGRRAVGAEQRRLSIDGIDGVLCDNVASKKCDEMNGCGRMDQRWREGGRGQRRADAIPLLTHGWHGKKRSRGPYFFRSQVTVADA